MGHSKLDELLQDEELIGRKREIHQQKPKRLTLGPDCVVCGVKVKFLIFSMLIISEIFLMTYSGDLNTQLVGTTVGI